MRTRTLHEARCTPAAMRLEERVFADWYESWVKDPEDTRLRLIERADADDFASDALALVLADLEHGLTSADFA